MNAFPSIISMFFDPKRCARHKFKNLVVFDFVILSDLAYLSSLKAFNECHLKILNIPMIMVSTDEFMELGKSFQSLQILRISLSKSKPAEEFIFPHCPELQILELARCNFTGSKIQFPSFPKLSTFKIAMDTRYSFSDPLSPKVYREVINLSRHLASH